MATKSRVKKASEPRIPTINWSDELVWALLAELEKEENYRVLFGKKDPSEVSICYIANGLPLI